MFSKENMSKAIYTLMVMAVAWLFAQTLRVDPVVTALGELKTVTIENQVVNRELHKAAINQQQKDREDNADQHAELSLLIYDQNTRYERVEVKLNRVMLDCVDNHDKIVECQRFHNRQIFDQPFDILKDK